MITKRKKNNRYLYLYLIRTFLCSICILFVSQHANALSFWPFVTEFAVFGENRNKSFYVENKSDQPTALEISVFSREMDQFGVESRVPAEDDFIYYPAQVILLPGQKKTIRMQYIGASDLASENAYRIIVEQLPIQIPGEDGELNDESGSKLAILTKYEGAIYVVPKDAHSAVVLRNFDIVDKSGKNFLMLEFENEGSLHQILRDLTLFVTMNDGKQITISSDKLKGVTGENILANHVRRFFIDLAVIAPKRLKQNQIQSILFKTG